MPLTNLDDPTAPAATGVPAAGAGGRDFYSITEAAALLGVSRVTIWRWIGAGRLPAARLGHRTTRITRADLDHAMVQLGPTGAHSRDGQHPAGPAAAANGAAAGELGAGDAAHVVQFYETDGVLLDAVAEFIGTALHAGDAGIVVATAEHRRGLEERLAAAGLDLAAVRASGRYVSLDAAETLTRFMADEGPDPGRFAAALGGIIARAAAGGRRVRIFGEMVALLTAAGNASAALRLEELWNGLQESHTFSLFCAYPLDRHGSEALAELLGDISGAHTRVIPAESYAALPTADDRLRAITLLQQKAHWLEAEVADRKVAEAALRASRDQLDAILASVAEGITVQDPAGQLLYANATAAHLIGYPSVEALLAAPGAAIHAAFRIMDEAGAPLPPDRLPGRRAVATRVPAEAVLRYDILATGETRWASVRAVPVLDDAGAVRFAVTAFQEITALKQADELQQRLAAIVTSSEDAIISKTLDAVITSWNAAAERMYGYTAAEAIGHSIAMLVPSDRPDELPAIMARLRRGERIDHYETERVRKEGTRLAVSLSISPIRDAAGRLRGASTIARDITVQKRTEAERDRALADVQAALRVRDEFLASISHDLRTPLSAIKGLTQLVLRQAGRAPTLDSTHVANLLADVNRSASRMAAMIDELLDLTRLESGRPLELNRQPTDLVALARQVAAEHQRGTRAHQITVEAADATLMGTWDPTRLDRVVSNLLSNAIKYSPAGGTITVRLAHEETERGIWATLAVQDEGVGIPAADLPHIFERFHRGSNVLGQTRGVGIGLAGSKQLVEQHGGTIAVASAEDAGTTATIRLPCNPQDTEAEGAEA